MEFKKKSTKINKWLTDRAGLFIEGISPARHLAEKNKLTSQAIYNYVEMVNDGKRDIRVVGDQSNPEVWEVKRLGK